MVLEPHRKYDAVSYTHLIPNETRNLVVDLYRNKYYDANFEHFTELLGKHEDIYISPSAVMSILEAEYILSPKATKAKKKRIKEQLKAEDVYKRQGGI